MRTPIALRGVFEQGEPLVWLAECDTHQWAVKDGNVEAVEALIREHVREHPTLHCDPPPHSDFKLPKERYTRYKVQRYEWQDGTVTYCGECGACPSPGWHILHHSVPVDAYMEQHWVAAHQGDTAEERHG